METFSALLAIYLGDSPASDEFPTQRPMTRSFDVFFDLCLNKRLRKQSWGWWFETPSRPLWRHCNGFWYILLGIFRHHHQKCEFVNVEWRIQYIPRNMHTVFALLCFVVVIHWLIFPYPPGLLHWHCGNLTIAPVPVKQPWWIWINTSCEFIMNDCITTTNKAQQNRVHISWDFLGYFLCQ